jgi:hypothetical protein
METLFVIVVVTVAAAWAVVRVARSAGKLSGSPGDDACSAGCSACACGADAAVSTRSRRQEGAPCRTEATGSADGRTRPNS